MTSRESPDPSEVSAEEFARLVRAWDDDAIIAEGVRAVGLDALLERVFSEMCERVREDEAAGVTADVQWEIVTPRESRVRTLRFRDGACEVIADAVDDPKVTFRLDVAAFAKLITGNADPVKLVLTRRMRISGSLLFARRVPRLFRMPGT